MSNSFAFRSDIISHPVYYTLTHVSFQLNATEGTRMRTRHDNDHALVTATKTSHRTKEEHLFHNSYDFMFYRPGKVQDQSVFEVRAQDCSWLFYFRHKYIAQIA